jgi:deoxycytidine triphosphate deaminase
MYLLTSDQIMAAMDLRVTLGRAKDLPLGHTFIYARLGYVVQRSTANGWRRQDYADGETISLGPKECMRIQTRETFGFNDRVLGIFGSTSDLAQDGVALLHGPFIDPLFPRTSDDAEVAGRLDLALVNHSMETVKLVCGQTPVVKLCLFDVSDTYPVVIEAGSATEAKNKGRQVN